MTSHPMEDRSTMHCIRKSLYILPSLLLLTACVTAPPPQPASPSEEQFAILQKQMLELQKIQNDTKTKLDEAYAAMNALSAKVKALEEKQAVSKPQLETGATPTIQAASVKSVKKKTPAPKKKSTAKKKKKKIRRQE